MQKIYLIRHGETDWNREMRYQGRRDIPLSVTGRRQAQILSDYLEKEKIEIIYSSPLVRARETAALIARKHELEPVVEESMMEIDFGEWEGRSYTNLTKEQQLVVDRWFVNPEITPIPGGDSYPEYRQRVLAGYQGILDSKVNNAAIVAHAGVVRVIVAAVLEIPPTALFRIRLRPTSLTILCYDDQKNAYLKLLNAVCHLDGP